MSVIGIDFGNKNAVVAAAGRGGVDVILNGNSNRLNACMIGFSESRNIGEAAQSTATSNFRNTISNMKRLVGLSYTDPRAQAEMKQCSFTCVPIPHPGGVADTIGVQVSSLNNQVIPIEAVAGMMIKHMGSLAAAKTAEEGVKAGLESSTDVNSPFFPRDCVIAVPGYYTDAQKRGFLCGCYIVGMTGILRLMHEHTATALAYGIFKDIRKVFTKDKPTQVMFLDVGASSYSCSIVAFEPGKLSVKTAQYDTNLGGRNFDEILAEWISSKFEETYKNKLSGKPLEKPKVFLKLLAAAEKAKKMLSPAGVRETRIGIECLMDDLDFNCVLKAEEYEELCAPLLARLAGPIQRALAETNMATADLSSVELVGGGTRVGSVKRTFGSILGLDNSKPNFGLSTTMNADESVARGAALQSAILSPRFKVLPYEIVEYQLIPVKVTWDGEVAGQQEGVEVEGETDTASMPTNCVVMFDRGSNFNVVRRVTLRRSGEFHVHASYDESATIHQLPQGVSREIVSFKIQAPEGTLNKVRVNVKQDLNGIISMCSAQMIEETFEEAPIPDPTKDDSKDTPQINTDQNQMEVDKTEHKENKVAPKQDETVKPELKKKVKRTNLVFDECRPLQLTKAEIDKAFEEEVAMANIDRVVKETADKRNELESYIYDMRDKIISESHLAPYAGSKEKSAFTSLLESTENWLYEDGFDAVKSVYGEKLSELKTLGDPIESRQKEVEARPNALSALQRTIDKYNKWLGSTSGNEQYAHITAEEIAKCRDMCDSISSWMYEKMDAQGMKPLYEDPVMKVTELNAKCMELARTVNPIMYKVKPKPPKEETVEPSPAEENKNAAESSNNSQGDTTKEQAMDTDDKVNVEIPGESMDV